MPRCECAVDSIAHFIAADTIRNLTQGFVVCAFVVAASWLCFLARWARCPPWREWWKIVCRSLFCALWSKDPDHLHLRTVWSTQIASRGVWVFFSYGAVCMVYTFRDTVYLQAQGVWESADESVLRDFWYNGTFLYTLMSSVMGLCVALLPRSTRVTHGCHVLAYVQMWMSQWMCSNLHTYLMRSGVAWAVRVCLAVVFGNTPLVIVMNVSSWISHLFRVTSSEAFSGFLGMFLWVDGFIVAGTVTVSALMEITTWREISAREQAQLSSLAEGVANSLLSLVCDAVFHLDEDLRLKTPSPTLTTFLLKSSQQALCGEAFESVVVSADRERFREFTRRSDLALCLHLHVMDADGSRVAVQLFHSPLEVRGRTEHLVGIREEVDRGNSHSQPQTVDQIPCWVHDGSESPTCSTSSSSTGFSADEGEADCSFTVNAMSEHLDVLHSTPKLCAIVGPMDHQRLLDWLVKDKAAFVRWLNDSTSEYLEVRNRIPDYRVQLATPHLRSVGCTLRATCVVSLTGRTTEDSVPVRICLHEVKVKNRRHGSARTARAGTPSLRNVRVRL